MRTAQDSQRRSLFCLLEYYGSFTLEYFPSVGSSVLSFLPFLPFLPFLASLFFLSLFLTLSTSAEKRGKGELVMWNLRSLNLAMRSLILLTWGGRGGEREREGKRGKVRWGLYKI